MILLTEQNRIFYDPLTRGLTKAGVAWGIDAMSGLCFAIAQDAGEEEIAGVALFVGEHGQDIDYTAPVGIALDKSATVTTAKNTTFKADTWYRFDARAFNAAGVLGDSIGSPRLLRTDASGDILDPAVPNPPTFVSAVAIAGGKVRVSVGYATLGQSATPVDVEVYGKQVTDPVDPDASGLWDLGNRQTDEITGLAAVPVDLGASRFTVRTGAKTDGQYWIFGAVFRNSAGGRGANEVVSRAVTIDGAGAEEVTEFSVF